MSFQTIFYTKPAGKIINIIPNKYIKSKLEKLRFCPGYAATEVAFLYFPSQLPIDPATFRIQFAEKTLAPCLVDASGMPMFYPDRRQKFFDAKSRYGTIIIELNDGVGDYLIQVSVIMEAQLQYPETKFFCKVNPSFQDVVALSPDVAVFTDYKSLNLDPKQCGTIILNGSLVTDPRGGHYGKASLYGLFLNLPFVPYNTRLIPPANFDQGFAEFSKSIGLRADGHNVIFHFRSKDWEQKSWEIPKALELAHMIKEVYDCTIFYIGSPPDWTGSDPNMVNLCGKTTWLQTVYLLTKASKIFCIDSAVLHLCWALRLPCIRLWGFTHPWNILGAAPGPMDIVDREEKSETKIKEITPLRVFNRAFPALRPTLKLVYDPARDYSQHEVQKIIFQYFTEHPPKHRLLVDVGAYGKDMSNTFALLKHGWKGLLIEAHPARLKTIEKDFAGLDVEILSIGISDRRGKLPFYIHTVAGHDSFMPDWLPASAGHEKISVETYPLKDVLEEKNFPKDFDLLSVDTEGMDETIMKKFFTDSDFRPSLIITECTSYKDAAALFNQHGYSQIAFQGAPGFGELIFAKNG
jgi:FkbM family methyltransferase